MYGLDSLCGISKVPLNFHTMYLIYSLKDMILTMHWNSKEFLDLRAQTHFWNTQPHSHYNKCFVSKHGYSQSA